MRFHRATPSSRLQRRQTNRIESGFVAKHRTIHPTTTQFLFSSAAVWTRPGMPFIESAPLQLRKLISKTVWVVDCKAGDGRTMAGVCLDHNYFSIMRAPKLSAYKLAKTVCR